MFLRVVFMLNPAFLFDDVDQSARHASVRLAGSEHAKRWKSANLLKPEYAMVVHGEPHSPVKRDLMCI